MVSDPLRLRRSTAPVLCVDRRCETAGEPLIRFGWAGAQAPGALSLLGGQREDECWQSNLPGGFRFASVAMAYDLDVADAAERAYRALLAEVRGSATPYLLRIWNFFAGINQGDGDAECYRQFCIGRARAVDRAFHDPAPAATAIGWPVSVDDASNAHSKRLEVVALCGDEPGIALENPRQTPAWRYPREYGPVSPGFSRGAVVGHGATAVLLASGTASIVGHVSRHVGDVVAQLDESLANLEALLSEGARRSLSDFSPAGCMALRVYLRDPAHADAVSARLYAWLGDRPVLRMLHGEVCRRELEIEIEGVFAAD